MALIQKSVKKGNVNSNRNENAIVDDVKNLIDTTSNYYELLSYSTNSSNITISHYLPTNSRLSMLAFQVPSLNLNKLYTYYVDKFSNANVVVEGINPNLTINNENISSISVQHLNYSTTVTVNFNGKYFDSINYGNIATFNVPNLIAVNQLATYISAITDCSFVGSF
jgi:hypothetical protein